MQTDLTVGIVTYIVFVYSTVCHEAAHAWSAMKLGDRTAYEGGQVSLDPTPHIMREPFGMVIIPLLMLFTTGGLFGWASAPVNREWTRRNPRHAALVALAGPAANFLLCIAAAVLMFLGVKAGGLTVPHRYSTMSILIGTGGTAWEVAALLLSVIFSMNLLLGIFNLLPAPPLDGSNIPLLFLKGRTASRYQDLLEQPAMRLIAFLLAYLGFGFIYKPIFYGVCHLLHALFSA